MKIHHRILKLAAAIGLSVTLSACAAFQPIHDLHDHCTESVENHILCLAGAAAIVGGAILIIENQDDDDGGIVVNPTYREDESKTPVDTMIPRGSVLNARVAAQ